MTDEKQQCDNCHFSKMVQVGQYQCLHNPPQVVMVPMQTMEGTGVGAQSVFPVMPAEGWCGKWVPKHPTMPPLKAV